jgi:membrane protein implicated in regulation of membrane protease activity
MDDFIFKLWLGFGLICVVSEFLLPGLVMVFVGLGSLTVALGMHLGYIGSVSHQFIAFFISSTIYLITLRFLVLRFVPTNAHTEDIDEDHAAMGSIVEVVEDILAGELGRIEHSESTWQAKTEDETTVILKGEKAKIIGRDNITWIVQKI